MELTSLERRSSYRLKGPWTLKMADVIGDPVGRLKNYSGPNKIKKNQTKKKKRNGEKTLWWVVFEFTFKLVEPVKLITLFIDQSTNTYAAIKSLTVQFIQRSRVSLVF